LDFFINIYDVTHLKWRRINSYLATKGPIKLSAIPLLTGSEGPALLFRLE
jgi:hypothetical protein